jgi:heme exporter protein A
LRIIAENVEKKFNHRHVIKGINFQLEEADSLVVTGANGTGKTTLVRMISGLLSPSSGKIEYFLDGQQISRESVYSRIGLVGPYLQLYKDLTAWENLAFFAKARHGKVDADRILDLMEYVGLAGREHDELKTYSSGMLQRIKYVAALYHDPDILILDEPTANLDEVGKHLVYDIIEKHKQQHIVIIATNEVEEIKYGAKRVDVVQ